MALNTPSVFEAQNQSLTLLDLARRKEPDGSTAVIAEILNETNEILQDIPYKEGNLPTGERVAIRTGLPQAYWKMLNCGVPSSKSQVAWVDETLGICQSRSIIDAEELKLNNNSETYRLTEETPFIEALNQEMTRTLFKGDGVVDGFVGLEARYDKVGKKDSQLCYRNVFSAGGTGNKLTSIWIINWGLTTCYGIYPKGTKAGLEKIDSGLIRVTDANNNPFYAYESLFTWRNGLVVKDWRSVARICNIDVPGLLTSTDNTCMSTGEYGQYDNLIRLLNRAVNRVQSKTSGKLAIYMHDDVVELLNEVALKSNKGVLTIDKAMNAMGVPSKQTLSFFGHPIRRVSALTQTEKEVTVEK